MKYYVSKLQNGQVTGIYEVVSKLSEIKHKAGDQFIVLTRRPDRTIGYNDVAWPSVPLRVSDGRRLVKAGDVVLARINRTSSRTLPIGRKEKRTGF